MRLLVLMCLSNPINWLVVLMLIAGWSRLFRRVKRKPQDATRFAQVGSGTTEAATAALLFLSAAYRPSQEFVAKAQIQEHEEADDDDQGGPDSPRKHLQQQLRRIRHGELIDRLVWFLE